MKLIRTLIKVPYIMLCIIATAPTVAIFRFALERETSYIGKTYFGLLSFLLIKEWFFPLVRWSYNKVKEIRNE